jgi:hypothetical protein
MKSYWEKLQASGTEILDITFWLSDKHDVPLSIMIGEGGKIALYKRILKDMVSETEEMIQILSFRGADEILEYLRNLKKLLE